MASNLDTAPEMRLFDEQGNRLYLTADERGRFLDAAAQENREDRIFCHVLHYTGCRPSEALELSPRRIHLDAGEIVFRSLKMRRKDAQDREKRPQYRAVPVPASLLDQIDLVFDLRRRYQSGKELDDRLWSMSRSTEWRMVKRVMDRARITGPQATGKGLRHGFGIAMLSGPTPLPLNVLRDLMGHSDTKTTEIYLQAIGYEKRHLVMQAWDVASLKGTVSKPDKVVSVDEMKATVKARGGRS
ncbi:tyrosine-type recombinase/integrase [Sedimenticola sp.]|uniref:tyrosine-type recombinase/integrase n=1 Tax=Sedimenticola sp. TaxID=1940285 RepID=UPI003D10E26E